MITLNEEQKKILHRTFLHLMSYGKKDGTYEIEINYGEIEDYQDDFYSRDHSKISCPVPTNFAQMCMHFVDKSLFDKYANYDSNVTIKFKIDVEKRVFDIEVSTQIMRQNELSVTYTFEELPDDVKEIIEQLKKEKVKELETDYDGSGDSGDIQSFSYGGINFDPLDDFCYRILSNNFGGWEINEGSSGKIFLNPFDEENTIDVIHYENYYDYETEQAFETKIS